MARTRRDDSEDDFVNEADDDLPAGAEITGSDVLSASTSRRELSWWRLWLPFAVAFATAGFSGSREPWVLAVIAFLAALNVWFVPQSSRVPRLMRVALILLVLLPLTGFLPLSPSSWPEWRLSFRDDFGVTLSSFRSPQPGVTFESWMMWAVGLVWAWHCMGRGFGESERRRLVRMLSLFFAVLALIALYLRHQGLEMPSLWRGHWQVGYFGPFPNRNHFGALLAMGAVLAFAATYDAHRRRSPWWLLYALCIVPMFWALITNTSRGGVILFFVALVAWMGLASFSRRSAQRLGVAAAVLFAMAAMFLLFGQKLLERFKTSASESAGLIGGGRVQMFSDTINNMIRRAPMLGCSLGNFEPVFALQKEHINNYSRDLHPESDWLWLASEAGLPAALAALFALGLYIRRTGPWRAAADSQGRTDRRLRNACAVAALVLPLAGIADTAAHSPGVIMPAILLAGMSLRRRRHSQGHEEGDRVARPQPLHAIFCAACGLFWLLVAAGDSYLPGASAARMAERKAERLYSVGDLTGAYEAMSTAIARSPMEWNYYFERAAIALPLGLQPQAVLEDFLRTRFLEPQVSLICPPEAELWEPYYPKYALQAWREGMRRDSSRQDSYYSMAAGLLKEHPELRSAVRDLAVTPKLKLDYLGIAEKGEFDGVLRDLLEQTPELEVFTSEERLRLFRQWYQNGDRRRLLEDLQQKVHWRGDGWPVLASEKAAAGDFAGACQIALDNQTPPASGSLNRGGDMKQLVRSAYLNPTDFGAWFELFDAQKEKKLYDEALATLDKISHLPDAPLRVLYEQATILHRKGDSARAWEKMQLFIEKRPAAAPVEHPSAKSPEPGEAARKRALSEINRGVNSQ